MISRSKAKKYNVGPIFVNFSQSWQMFGYFLNSICAMAVDIRPATGAVATLAKTLWGVVGLSSAGATYARYVLRVRVE